MTYRSMNVGREPKATANKHVFVCIYFKQGRSHRLIHVKGIFKVV